MKIAHIADVHIRSLSAHKQYKKAFEIMFEQFRTEKIDLLVIGGDVIHNKLANLSPEQINLLTWFFTEASSIAPTITILGNHDGNLVNLSREDVISSIHVALNNKKLFLLKKAGTYKLTELIPSLLKTIPAANNTYFSAFSPFDKDNWNKVRPNKSNKNNINIALYHGSISNCVFDNDFQLRSGEQRIEFFRDYDYGLFGDIHKKQWLYEKLDVNGVKKPCMGYCGSTIQQKVSEDLSKGWLLWDIRSNNDWDVEFKEVPNLCPFLTIEWQGSITKTVNYIEENYKHLIHDEFGARIRIASKVIIPQVQTRLLEQDLKNNFGVIDVSFKNEVETQMDTINTNGITISKKSLSRDPETIIKLYHDYIKAHKEAYTHKDTDELNVDTNFASEIIKKYLGGNKSTEVNDNAKTGNDVWSIKELYFDNLYGYGEGNYVNFQNLKNVIGIFGDNATGKSSIIAALMYVLFNSTDRGSIKNSHLINRKKDKCFGWARINVGNTDYVIERKTEKNLKNDEKSLTSVSFWKIDNIMGQEIRTPANGLSRDDTDVVIRELIGNGEDFLLTAFSSQGDVNRFIANKATKRKEILNRFLELDIFDKLYELVRNDYATLNNIGQRYSFGDWSKSIFKTEKEIEKLDKDLAGSKEKLTALLERKEVLKLWIKENEKSANSEDHAQLANIEQHIVSLNKNFEVVTEKIKTNKQELQKNTTRLKLLNKKVGSINIEVLKKKLNDIEDLKEKFKDLEKTFHTEQTEQQSQEKSIKKLELVPCGDQFPTCRFIQDGHEAKTTIAKQKKLVDGLKKQYEGVEKTIETYTKQKIKEKTDEYNSLVLEKTSIEAKINHLQDNIDHDILMLQNNKDDLRSSKAKLKTYKKSIDFTKSEQYKKKLEKYKKTEEEYVGLTNRNNELLISYGGKKEILNKLLKEQEENKDLIKKLRVYESIQAAFSKNGIPAMILKTQLPAINKELVKVLSNVVDFSVELETDVNSNIMDVYVEDRKGRRLIELCSGMEKTMCSIAIRTALGNLSSIPRPDIMILDEAFVSLDENNLQRAIELLSVFLNYFKAIFVISHLALEKEMVDNIIEVGTENGFSKINVN